MVGRGLQISFLVSGMIHLIFRFKAEIELRSPGSVVEIDTVKVGKKVHFSRFFCAFKGSIDGFLEGCRLYISIDSTALNG